MQPEFGHNFTPAESCPCFFWLKRETFTLCDSAVDSSGKVCVSAAFDSVATAEAPDTGTQGSVVARLRFHRIEEGNLKLR